MRGSKKEGHGRPASPELMALSAWGRESGVLAIMSSSGASGAAENNCRTSQCPEPEVRHISRQALNELLVLSGHQKPLIVVWLLTRAGPKRLLPVGVDAPQANDAAGLCLACCVCPVPDGLVGAACDQADTVSRSAASPAVLASLRCRAASSITMTLRNARPERLAASASLISSNLKRPSISSASLKRPWR